MKYVVAFQYVYGQRNYEKNAAHFFMDTQYNLGCLEGVQTVSKGSPQMCMGCINVSEEQVRNGQVSAGHFRSGQVGTG